MYGLLDCKNEGTVILQNVLLFFNGPPLNPFKIFPSVLNIVLSHVCKWTLCSREYASQPCRDHVL